MRFFQANRWISVSLATLLASSLISPAVHAGGCGTFTPCGEVENQSRHLMHYTTVWGNAPGEGTTKCNGWNSNGGFNEAPGMWGCTPVPTMGHAGGGDVDVDALTFPNLDYEVLFESNIRFVKKGVWTRVQSHELGECYDLAGGEIQCDVTTDLL